MSLWDDFKKQVLDSTQSQKDADIKNVEDIAAKQTTVIKDLYNSEIANTEEDYYDQLRTNEIQKIINQRDVEQTMANLGLTNSGLNRSQQTAVQLSAGNNAAKLTLAKQKAVEKLALAMRSEISTIENKKISDIAGINSSYDANATDKATEMYNNHIDNQTKIEEAKIDFANKKSSARNDLIKIIYDNNLSDEAKWTYFTNFSSTYGFDETDNSLKPFIKNALKTEASKLPNKLEANFYLTTQVEKGYLTLDEAAEIYSSLQLPELSLITPTQNESFYGPNLPFIPNFK